MSLPSFEPSGTLLDIFEHAREKIIEFLKLGDFAQARALLERYEQAYSKVLSSMEVGKQLLGYPENRTETPLPEQKEPEPIPATVPVPSSRLPRVPAYAVREAEKRFDHLIGRYKTTDNPKVFFFGRERAILFILDMLQRTPETTVKVKDLLLSAIAIYGTHFLGSEMKKTGDFTQKSQATNRYVPLWQDHIRRLRTELSRANICYPGGKKGIAGWKLTEVGKHLCAKKKVTEMLKLLDGEL